MITSWFHPPTWLRSRRRRIAAALASAALPAALVLWALGAPSPAAAANGDNLRTFIADRSGTLCASVDAAGNMSGHGFGGSLFALGVGVGFDGTNLLLSCYNDNTVTAVSPANGAQVAVHHITGASTLGALAWDNGRKLLWACSNSNAVGTIDLATNAFTFKFTSGGCFDGLAYDGSDDTIWTSPDASSPVSHYTTAGFLLGSFPVSLGGYGNSGIAVGGSLLYLANDGGQQIYQVNKTFSPAPTLFASFPRRIEDLECDNLTFATGPTPKGAIWSVDAYDNILNAWEIPNGACVFGGGGSISLTPAVATNPAGTDHTVTANVTSGGLPLVGQVVTFSVTGQNAGETGTCVPASCASDASGNVTFTYHDTNGAGTDTISASFVNASGATQTATATKTWVGDAAISAAGVAVAATEGAAFSGTVATFTDPDTSATAAEYTASIDWGDASSSPGTISGSAGSFTVSGSHTYAEQGTYTVTVTITDTDNAANQATATSTATVADAPVTAGALTLSAGVEGSSPTTASFSFSDANTGATAAEYTATINWGDASTSAGTVSGGAGSFTVSGSHQYAEEGTYTVTVTATGDGTDSATATGSAIVADAPLTSACAMPSLTTQAFSGKTATFTDASSTGTLSDFSASINWGDSSTSAGTIAGGPGTTAYTVSGSHTYASTGYFTVTTTITDVGGSTTKATCTNVLVFAFAPGGGAFAIGDKENKIGASVNFWGAQWAKNNPVSSGTVVSAFKGFAAKPTTPTCGTTWSADPGNSTPPPAGPLPAYMGVIVTSRYSQSGSLISGNIVHIVIVKTDPGYAPNPGHPGTGTVVAQVC